MSKGNITSLLSGGGVISNSLPGMDKNITLEDICKQSLIPNWYTLYSWVNSASLPYAKEIRKYVMENLKLDDSSDIFGHLTIQRINTSNFIKFIEYKNMYILMNVYTNINSVGFGTWKVIQ